MKNQLNTANYIRIYAERIAMFTMDGTAWETIVKTIDRLRVKAVGHSAYITACIGHAWQTAHTQTDTQETRADIYADIEMLELYIFAR